MASPPLDGITARETLSRILVAQSRRMARVELPAPLTLLGQEILDDVMVSHPLGWTITPPMGWGTAWEARRHTEIEAMRVNPGTRELHLRLRDLRGSIARSSYWVQGRASCQSDATLGPVALANNLVCYRGSPAWTEYASGQVVTTVGAHVPRFTPQGVLVERITGGILTDSCMSRGGTDWTAMGTGVNGSAAAGASAYIVWDKAWTNGYWLLTAGNPHAADLYIQQVSPYNVLNGNKYVFAFTYLAPAGLAGTAYQILLGGNYWNAGTQAWQAGAVWNSVNGGESGTPKRWITTFGANTTAAPTVRIGCPTGGTAARQVCVFDAEIQIGGYSTERRWAGSRIRTPYGSPGTTETRQGDYVISRDNLPPQGTVLARVTPRWSTIGDGDVPIGNYVFTVFSNRKGGLYPTLPDGIQLYYNGPTLKWVLARRASGATTTITGAFAYLARDTEYKLAFRWESLAGGELRVKYGTPAGGNAWFDLTANGETIYGQSVPPAEPGAGIIPMFFHGCDCLEDTQFEGFVSIVALPYVLSDDEVAKWL